MKQRASRASCDLRSEKWGESLGQEELIKRRMVRAVTMFVITLIALIVFIGLYIDEKRRVQETYRAQYRQSLLHVSEDIGDYLNGESDYDMRYTRVTCDMCSANSFAFLIEDFTEERKTVNSLYTCMLKYPEQMQTRLEELDQAVTDITADLDKGYEEAQALVDSIDKMGH